MQKLNVALVVGGFPSKADHANGIFNYRAAKGLSDKVNVTVIHIRGWRPGRPFLYKREKYNGINVIRVCTPRIPIRSFIIQRFNDGLSFRLGWFFLKNYLKKVDVIHSVFITYGGVFGSYWKSKLGNKVKHVSEAIGSDVNSQLPQFIADYKSSFWPDNMDGILYNSMALETNAKKFLPDIKNTAVVYKGIDPNRFDHIALSQKEDKNFFEILYLGGYPKYSFQRYGQNTKGGITLMKAWQILEGKTDMSNIRLSIGGPDSNIPFVNNWIASLKQPDQVKVVGYLPVEEVPTLIAQADIVVIPSMEEGLPNLLLEAGLLTTPVIASRVGGMPEVIIDNESGFLFQPADENELALNIQKVMQHKNLEHISLKARDNVIENFNANNFTSGVLEMYESLHKKTLVCVE